MSYSFELNGAPAILIMLVVYVYSAYCMYRIAQRTNTPSAWMAFFPLLNVFLAISIAKKPWWYFILLLIPLVNIVFAIIITINIAKSRGKSGFEGFLLCIPFVNFIVLGHLAFGE